MERETRASVKTAQHKIEKYSFICCVVKDKICIYWRKSFSLFTQKSEYKVDDRRVISQLTYKNAVFVVCYQGNISRKRL